MPRYLPIKPLKQISKEYDLKQVIIFAWDGDLQHVATYGQTVEECDKAAQFGDDLKKALKWEDAKPAYPSRVKRLMKENKELREALKKANNA